MDWKNKILAVLLAGIINTACGQYAGKGQVEKPVTREQYNNISKAIKTFDHNPTYQVRFTAAFCTYEIYINDMLATFSFTTGNSAGEQHADIPQYILKSGKQKIRVKVFPKAIEDGKLEQALTQKAEFSVCIAFGEYNKDKHEDFKEVWKLKMPMVQEPLPFYEMEGVFDAEVPYMLKGWSDGEDLTMEPKEQLKKEVLQVYDRFSSAFEKKDVKTVATMIYNREKEVAQAFFFKSGEPKSYDDGWEKLSTEASDLVSIRVAKDIELRYFAGGKVVALLKASSQDRDFPAIEGETESSYIYYALYLYRPEPGAPLEIIR
ncbi:MAG TPA: hypothetical protein VN040_14935 [Pseudosphingobacterium sp.]|nr:hypothetical protein [Pseudosphingobacterium sp.]